MNSTWSFWISVSRWPDGDSFHSILSGREAELPGDVGGDVDVEAADGAVGVLQPEAGLVELGADARSCLSPPPPPPPHAVTRQREARRRARAAAATRRSRDGRHGSACSFRRAIQWLRILPRKSLARSDLRVGEELLGFGVLDDRAVGHEHHPVRRAAGEAHLVGHHEHRHALLGQRGHDVQHLVDHLGVERAGRLVEQHHLGVHRQRAGDRHALLLTAGQLGRVLVGLVGDADPLEQRHRLGAGLVLGLSCAPSSARA